MLTFNIFEFKTSRILSFIEWWTGRHIFTVNGDVVINTFGRYFAVTSSPGSSFFGIGVVQPLPAPTPTPTPSAPSCFFMIAGHCLIPNF